MNGPRPGRRLRTVGWLLTPLVVWAVSFFGGWLGATLGRTLGWLIAGAVAGGLVATATWMLVAAWRRRARQRHEPAERTSSET